jgi:O-antigen/teichoic acid export membrane protein
MMIVSLRTKLAKFDWSMLKGSTLVSLALMVARVLGLLFGIVLARALDPDKYGYVQFGIAFAGVLAILTQPFGQHVMARYISRFHNDTKTMHEYLNNAWAVLFMLFVGSLLVAVPVMLLIGSFDVTFIIIYVGFTAFYAYYGLGRGFASNERVMAAFLASNALQLVLTIIVYFVIGTQDTTPALLIYGLVYFPVLAVLMRLMPLPIGFKFTMPRREIVLDLLKFSVPVWIGHACFTLVLALDRFFLEAYRDTQAVGVFSFAVQLGMVFMFVPMGLNTVLLARAAKTPRDQHGKLLRNSMTFYLGSSFPILIGWLLLYNKVAGIVSGGEQYSMEPLVYGLVAVGTILFAMQGVFESVLIGRGTPNQATISRLAGLAVAVGLGFALVPTYGLLGAALMKLGGAGVAVAFFLYYLTRK